MPREYKDHTVRLNARIPTDVYNNVVSKLHYGQVTILLTNFFESLDKIIEAERFEDIVLYINNIKPLILPTEKEE